MGEAGDDLLEHNHCLGKKGRQVAVKQHMNHACLEAVMIDRHLGSCWGSFHFCPDSGEKMRIDYSRKNTRATWLMLTHWINLKVYANLPFL